MTAPRDNGRGILLMNAAMFAFIVNDSFVKAATATLPLGEVIFVRGAIACALVTAYCAWTGAFRSWRQLLHRNVGLRTVAEIFSTLLYLTGFVRMPIANATAIFQVTPLAVTAAAAIFLREPVGWRRWTAIAIGFAGVMIIVRPGLEGFDAAALFILGSVGFVVLRDMATARMPARLPGELATALVAPIIALTGIALIPFEHLISAVPTWRWPDPKTFGMLAGAGLFLLAGYVLLIDAFRRAEMAAVAPFRYTLLVWSFVIGITVFGERPDAATLAGAAIVVATGLYAFRRERLRGRLAGT